MTRGFSDPNCTWSTQISLLIVQFSQKYCQNLRVFSSIKQTQTHTYIYIQNQTRMSYKAVYRHEQPAQYQPECRAHRAARRLILGWLRASIHQPSMTSEVGCVFIIPSSIQIDLFAIITLSLEVVTVLAMLTSLRPKNASAIIFCIGCLFCFP